MSFWVSQRLYCWVGSLEQPPVPKSAHSEAEIRLKSKNESESETLVKWSGERDQSPVLQH